MKRVMPLPVIMVVVFAACADHQPVEPRLTAEDAVFKRQDAPGQQRLAGLDAEFARMAQDIRGFGGMFYDEAGDLNVFVKDGPQRAGQASRGWDSGVKAAVGRSMRASGRAVPSEERIVIREAAYDFTELAAESERLLPVLSVPGVVFTDIDEARNRLRVGIEEGVDAERVRHSLQMLGVPIELVNLEVTEPIMQLSGHTLQHRQQPLAGGLQLVMPHPEPGFIRLCTLGFNVLREGRGRSENFFLTNSHCTETQGAVTGTPFFQQGLALEDPHFLIGIEVEDPALFPCSPTLVCRWSDAALVRYETRRTPVKFGAIYRTRFFGTGNSAGSLIVEDEGHPKLFTIQDEAPFPLGGEVLNKVGRTTGWTRGPVIGTCLNVLASGTNHVMLCQDLVAASVAGGDSGSPVFLQHGDSKNVTLYGILWGGGVGLFAFSALENIREDLGAFRTH